MLSIIRFAALGVCIYYIGTAHAENYDILFPQLAIDETRSAHKDTDYASLAVKVGARDMTDQTKFLGDLDNGGKSKGYTVGLSYRSVSIPADDTPVIVSWTVVNNGHAGASQMQNALDKVGGAVINCQKDSETACVILNILKGIGIGLLFADCDGVVVAGKYTTTGA